MVAPHPFSAAALSASATKGNSNIRPGNAETRTASVPSTRSSNSGSGARLLQGAPPSAVVSLADRNKPMPRIPAAAQVASSTGKQRVQKKKSPSPSRRSSRSRSSSHKTQSSKRSQRLPLVRPIIPKAELARQFNYNEQSPAESTDSQILAPRPHPPYSHNRSMSAPITDLPRAVIRAESPRRHSPASMALTVGSTSIHYGSDILRPEPGRTIRDKMRASVATKVQTPLTAYTQMSDYSVPSVPDLSGRTTPNYGHSDRDSWGSNTNATINAYTLSRYAHDEPSTPTFIGGWPMPPTFTTSMLASTLRSRGEPLSHSRDVRPRPSMPKMAVPAVPNPSVSNTLRLEQEPDQLDKRRSRPPKAVKGPRMQFPPPRSQMRSGS